MLLKFSVQSPFGREISGKLALNHITTTDTRRQHRPFTLRQVSSHDFREMSLAGRQNNHHQLKAPAFAPQELRPIDSNATRQAAPLLTRTVGTANAEVRSKVSALNPVRKLMVYLIGIECEGSQMTARRWLFAPLSN